MTFLCEEEEKDSREQSFGKDMIRLVGGAGRRKKQKKKRREGRETAGLLLPRRRPTVLHTATRDTTCATRGVERAIYTQ